MAETEILWVYITTGSISAARSLGRTLVEGRLAACINVIPGIESIYRWEGEIQQDQEVILIAKTTADRFEALKSRTLELHSYDCPCIIALGVRAGHADYLKWIREQVR